MSDFKPIESQEQFDAMIKGRLEQAERSFIEKYGNSEELKAQLGEKDGKIAELSKQLEEATKKIEGHKAEVDGLNAKVLQYETDSVKTRIAHEEGLPYEMASRLAGDNEEAIRADAKTLASMMKKSTPTPPSFNPEPEPKDTVAAAWAQLSNSLNKE